MAQALMAFQVVGAVAGGLSKRAEAMDASARATSEARLAETQALQRDTAAREDLSRFLGTVRSARAANGLSSHSQIAFLLDAEARDVSDNERLRQRADDRQRATNFRAAAKSYRRVGNLSLVTGLASAGASIAQFQAGMAEGV